MFFSSFSFIQSSQTTIVALVQSPSLVMTKTMNWMMFRLVIMVMIKMGEKYDVVMMLLMIKKRRKTRGAKVRKRRRKKRVNG